MVCSSTRNMLPQVSLGIYNWHVLGNRWIAGNTSTTLMGSGGAQWLKNVGFRAILSGFKSEFLLQQAFNVGKLFPSFTNGMDGWMDG